MGKQCDQVLRCLSPSFFKAQLFQCVWGRQKDREVDKSVLTWLQLLSFLGWLSLPVWLTVATDTLSAAGIQVLVSPLEDVWGPSPATFCNVHLAQPQILPFLPGQQEEYRELPFCASRHPETMPASSTLLR